MGDMSTLPVARPWTTVEGAADWLRATGLAVSRTRGGWVVGLRWLDSHNELLALAERTYVTELIADRDETDEGGWCERCQGMGSIDCHCGGDLCVCDAHGELPCPECAR